MIYIVEDDRNIQEIEIFALKNSGYQAVGFETAKEFYGALSEKLPEDSRHSGDGEIHRNR